MKMRPVFVAATGQHVGKTTVSNISPYFIVNHISRHVLDFSQDSANIFPKRELIT
jgi:hypothetical protein